MQTNNYSKLLFFVSLFLSVNYSMIAQVGINTTDPRTTLEIAGDVQISGDIDIGSITELKDSDESTFLIQDTDNSIKTLDVSNPTGAALGYIQEYIVEEPFHDWIDDFDTGIDANNYVLVTISAHFNDDLNLPNSGGLSDNFSLPFTGTFVSGGTWHITANYPVAGNFGSSNIGSWTITTLIFSKDLSKQLGTVTIPMAGLTTGSAVTPIID